MSKYQDYSQHYITLNNGQPYPDSKGPRGLYDDQITNHTKPLDALGRVFAKNPYSAIIQSVDNDNLSNNLYVSLPRRANNDDVHGLSDQDVTNLYNDLINVITDPQDVNKQQLFLAACGAKNTILHELLDNEKDLIRVQNRRQEISGDKYRAYYKYIQELKEGQTDDFFNPPNNSRRPGFLNDLIQHQFDNFLSQNDLDLLGRQNLDIQNKHLIRVPYYYDQRNNEHYKNVHVEAKGVHYAQQQTGANTFYVGLGEKGGSRKVGCCGKCCVEFGILEVDRDPAIIVYRTADYPINIPEGVYAISPNIRNNERYLFHPQNMIKGSIKNLIKESVDLNQEVENLTQERDDLQTKVSGKDEEIQKLDTKLEDKEKEAEKLKKESNKARKEVKDLEKKIQEQGEQFEQQKIQLTEELKKARQEVEEGKKQLQEQEKQLQEEYTKIKQLKEKLKLNLQKQVEQIEEQQQKASQKQKEKDQQKQELQEQIKQLESNNHLKQADKWMLSQDEDGQSYSLHDSLAAVNSNLTLLDKLKIKSVITADVDLKAIDVKEDMPQGKVGRVEFLAEHHHENDHSSNIQSLIEGIESGGIGEDTVIAIERKSYGKNLGMPDVVLLASIIEHNGRNPNNQLQIPEKIIKDSLIYHDALLYKTAKEHGVKVVGLEGRNLQADKSSPGEYDQAREEYMADGIHQLTCKGYNVIVHVGATHVDNLRKILESFTEIDISESSKQDRIISEVVGSDFVDEDAENFDGIGFSSCACEYSSQEIELTGDYTYLVQ